MLSIPSTKSGGATLWSRNFIVVSFINFFVLFIYYALLVTIGSYAMTTFQASYSMVGLVAGMMVIGCLVGRFLTGYLIEIIGCRKILFAGIFLFIISMSFYLLAANLTLLLWVRFISGISVGIIGTVTGTIVVYIVPYNRRGEGISYFSLSTIIATAVGPLIGLCFVSTTVPFARLFYLAILVGIISLLIALTLNTANLTFNNADKSTPHQKADWLKLSNYIEPNAIKISFVVMLVATGYAAIQSYFFSYVQQLNLLSSVNGLFFPIYAASILISRPFSGRLFDLKGENIIVYPSLFILAIGFILFGTANSSAMILIASALIGLGFGNFQSTAQAIAVKVSPHHKIGQATSTYFILFDLGVGLGPYFLGFFIPYVGYRGLYCVCGVISVIAGVLYFFLHGRKKAKAVVINR
ncbi:MFS transporter [Orbaceae bacterium ESL0727]|nr:MFS transporter [Orbaceae bacterium ESL0727]